MLESMQSVAVYCGSATGNSPAYTQAAQELGAELARRGLTLVYGWRYLRDRNLFQGEIPVLILFGTAGMMILVSAGSLLMVYLGLELLALCSYALVASNRENGLASEAAMKYIVLGSLASGLLLYGMSLIYGATGSLHLDVIRDAIPHSEERVLLITGAVFMIAGVAFKLGAAPFHMWLPDVYQGAPAPIALFISSAPKLAAFGMAYRLLEMGVGPLSTELQLLIAGLAAVSLVIGNLMAIAQSNLKRMLAFSTVSHIGFLLMGIGLISLQVAERRRRREDRAVPAGTTGFTPPRLSPGLQPPTLDPVAGQDTGPQRQPRRVAWPDKKGEAPYDRQAWRRLVESDPDLAQIAKVLSDYGPQYVDELATSYLAAPDKSRLSAIVDGIIARARGGQPAPPPAPVEGSRENATPAPDDGLPLPNTIACTVTAVPWRCPSRSSWR